MRPFSRRFSRPFAYMGTKIIANCIHDMLRPRTPSRLPDILDLSIPPGERLGCVEKLAEWKPVFNHAPGMPAAVKRNGGLRGSKATKWAR